MGWRAGAGAERGWGGAGHVCMDVGVFRGCMYGLCGVYVPCRTWLWRVCMFCLVMGRVCVQGWVRVLRGQARGSVGGAVYVAF